MNESVHATEVDECTECDNRRHLAVTNLARLEVVEEVVASFLLVLFQESATRQHNVVAVAVEFNDLCVDDLADVWLKVAHAAKFYKRCRQESTKADVDDESTLDNFDDGSVYNAVVFLLALNFAPGLFVLSTLLRKNKTSFFVFKSKNKRFNLFAECHNVVRVDIVLDCQFARWDNTLGLVSEFEQHSVAVDLDDGASNKLTVFEFHHGAIDGICEAGGEITFCDLARCVITFRVECSHWGGSKSCVGQGCGLSRWINTYRWGPKGHPPVGRAKQTLPPETLNSQWWRALPGTHPDPHWRCCGARNDRPEA